MRLAIPGRVVETCDKTGLHMARVEFGGVAREVCPPSAPPLVRTGIGGRRILDRPYGELLHHIC